jgi:hypothetical protein
MQQVPDRDRRQAVPERARLGILGGNDEAARRVDITVQLALALQRSQGGGARCGFPGRQPGGSRAARAEQQCGEEYGSVSDRRASQFSPRQWL